MAPRRPDLDGSISSPWLYKRPLRPRRSNMAISQPAAMEAFAKETSAPVNIRPAKLEEDDVLSRILCNAFLPVW